MLFCDNTDVCYCSWNNRLALFNINWYSWHCLFFARLGTGKPLQTPHACNRCNSLMYDLFIIHIYDFDRVEFNTFATLSDVYNTSNNDHLILTWVLENRQFEPDCNWHEGPMRKMSSLYFLVSSFVELHVVTKYNFSTSSLATPATLSLFNAQEISQQVCCTYSFVGDI